MLVTPLLAETHTFDEHIQHIPYFIFFVALGISANLLRKVSQKQTLKKIRIVEEIVGSLWIALVGAGVLDFYTDMSAFLIYGISSVLGYFHSFILDKVGKGLIEYFTKRFKKKLDDIFGEEPVVQGDEDPKQEE